MDRLQKQANELEAENQMLLDQKLDLEATVKTMDRLKAQVDSYKNKLVDVEASAIGMKEQLKRAKEEVERMQQKNSNVRTTDCFVCTSTWTILK